MEHRNPLNFGTTSFDGSNLVSLPNNHRRRVPGMRGHLDTRSALLVNLVALMSGFFDARLPFHDLLDLLVDRFPGLEDGEGDVLFHAVCHKVWWRVSDGSGGI